jgi:PqqD family protein of HPr-rel-A system
MLSVKEGLKSRELNGELILFDSSSGYVHQLNETGALIWDLVTQGGSLAQIESRLASEFGIEVSTIRPDLSAFISRLRDAGLLKLVLAEKTD